MTRVPAKNLLAKIDLSQVLQAALTPGQVPAAGAFKDGQTVAMPDGSRFMVIATDQCQVPHTWDRPQTIQESVERLKPSLKDEAAKNGTEFGNHDPIIIQGAAAPFEILSGKSRWLASKELGLKVLARHMARPKEGLEKTLFEVLANGPRTNLSPLETIKAAVVLSEAGASPDLIASALGRQRRSVFQYLQVAKNDSLMAQIASGEITYKDAAQSFSFQKAVEIDPSAPDVEAVPKGKAHASGAGPGIDLGPLRFTEYDSQKKIVAVSIRLRDASQAEKRQALKLAQKMVERLNAELNPADPRKTDRRSKEAVTPAKRRKVDKD